MLALLIIIALVCIIHAYRSKVINTPIEAKNHEDFDGELFQVGGCIVAHQSANEGIDKTIIGMHGWLEDFRYFAKLYTPQDGQLILMNSCDYHSPNNTLTPQKPNWDLSTQNNSSQDNSSQDNAAQYKAAQYKAYPPGSIEYDAAALITAVQGLACSKNLVLHGHSRGGAVVLEAVKQNPELFKDAEVILEAAILPEASIYLGPELPIWISKIFANFILYGFPFIATWLAKNGLSDAQLKTMGPQNERKTKLLKNLFSNPSSPKVLLNNIASMLDWPVENKTELFEKIKSGYILVGSSDSILSIKKMLNSANKNTGNMKIIKTENSSHFISLDIPEKVREIIAI